MSSLSSLWLCLIYASFLVFGGIIFKYLEYEVEETTHIFEPPEWTILKDLALREHSPADTDQLVSLGHWLPRACPALSYRTVDTVITKGAQPEAVAEVESVCPHLHYKNVTTEVIYSWSFIDALYFSMTVITTIGYGHLTPTSPWSQTLCILYSLVGIPLTGILLAWTSSLFSDKLLQLFKSRLSEEKQESNKFIFAATIVYVGFGFILFIFFPAALFTLLEDWTYMQAVYYSYITLTTIGFGDFVTGYGYEGSILYVYQLGVILWIMVGLGYWLMVANFITKALKSKQLKRSVKRSSKEVKKLMEQLGLKHHDPTFLRQHSKATFNLMLQLSNVIAIQDLEKGETSGMNSNTDSPTNSSTTSTKDTSSASSPSSFSGGGIPGLSSLFGNGLARPSPFSHLMGPLKGQLDMNAKTHHASMPCSIRAARYQSSSQECSVNEAYQDGCTINDCQCMEQPANEENKKQKNQEE